LKVIRFPPNQRFAFAPEPHHCRAKGAYAEIRLKCGHIARSLMIPGNLMCIFIQSACKLLILRESVFRDIGFFRAFRSEDSSSG
jgi:hypothetical protein